MNYFGRTFDFVKKHSEWFTVLGLCILFYFIFFHNIGNYPLMDVDETRYVSMARDMFHTKENLRYFFGESVFLLRYSGKLTSLLHDFRWHCMEC